MTNIPNHRPAIRVRGRSFMALVLTPEAPIADWIAALDEQIGRASSFFVERPIVLDLGLMGGDAPGLADLALLPQAFAERGIRLIATENVPEGFADEFGMLPPSLAGGRETGDQELPEPGVADPVSIARGLIIDEPVRSGRQVVFAQGDVTVLGSIASGAEVTAGGSIHVYGSLRGRAVAGFGGNPAARILCRKLHAELLAIDGFYLTADDMDQDLIGKPVQARLDGDRIAMSALD